MKIKRFVAKDMRSALAEVKQLLGPDAVILSNKKTAEGVEIVAAIDPQPTAQAAPIAAPLPLRDEPAEDRVQLGAAAAKAKGAAIAASLQELMARNVQQPAAPTAASTTRPQLSRPDSRSTYRSNAEPLARNAAEPLVRNVKFPRLGNRDESINSPLRMASRHEPRDEMGQVRQELAQLRSLLQHQLSGLMWQDLERREPLRAMLIERLRQLGFDRALADQIACYIPEELNEEQAWPQVMDLLSQQVLTGRDDILRQGGVVALVGPTGVGKTTTIAKLAARFAQVNGPDSVALISTDTYRIGAHEQLATYGRIIGCQVKLAHNASEMNELLQRFRNRKLVLIDTAGMSQRDERLQAHLEDLLRDSAMEIRSFLVLSANAQQRVMQEAVEHFRCVPLSGLIISKLDECLSLGEILGVAIQNALSISYLTDGQRVPEDLAVADGRQLIDLANALLEQNSEAAYSWSNEPRTGAAAARYDQYSQ